MKRTINKQKEEARLERNIAERCAKEEGLTFGYIGNFESWGDDRKLFIWVDGMDRGVNQLSIWECPATSLCFEAAREATAAIRGFSAGKLYGSINA